MPRCSVSGELGGTAKHACFLQAVAVKVDLRLTQFLSRLTFSRYDTDSSRCFEAHVSAEPLGVIGCVVKAGIRTLLALNCASWRWRLRHVDISPYEGHHPTASKFSRFPCLCFVFLTKLSRNSQGKGTNHDYVHEPARNPAQEGQMAARLQTKSSHWLLNLVCRPVPYA